MNTAIAPDPVLDRLKHELTELYGARLKQVLLYGSRARGDYREDSDYDVLVVIQPPFEWSDEVKKMGHISSLLTFDTGAVISLRLVTADQIQARTGFMHNVRNEAVELTDSGRPPVRPRRLRVRATERRNGALSPEAVDYLAKADRFLALAPRGLEAAIHESAARDAYLCALSAARAVIFHKTRVASKTHSGTRSEFFRLIKGTSFDPELAQFLRDAFETKQRVDYELVPENIGREKAHAFVQRAEAFVAAARGLLENKS